MTHSITRRSSPFGQRVLVVYSGVLTAVFAVVVLAGFSGPPASSHYDELTVQRINIVEADGTPRMVITNKARSPGLYLKGVEHLPDYRKTAGIVFLNDEGTENGGLIFGGAKDGNGNVSNYGHLSFDQYMQDQTMVLESQQNADQRHSIVTVTDRPTWDITELVTLLEHTKALPPEQQQAALARFRTTHPDAQPRGSFGRTEDHAAAMRLKDAQGRDRVIISVPATGDPVLQFLDANGRVTKQLP